MIQGFKIVGKKVQYSLLEQDKTGSNVTGELENRAIVHPDLQRALDKLRVHWGIVTGFINPKAVKNINKPEEALVEKIRVYGFSWFGGDEGNDGLQIMATLTTPGSYSVSFPTPSQALKRNAVPETRYSYMDEVLAIMDDVEERVDAYLDGSERGKDTEGGDKASKPKKNKVTHARVLKPADQQGILGGEWTSKEYADEMAKGKKTTDKKTTSKVPQSSTNPSGNA